MLPTLHRNQTCKPSSVASGSSAFAGANEERSTVAIDISRLFLNVRLRLVEMQSTVANTAHDTVINCCSKFTVLYHTLDLSHQIYIE
jgi:hypothetical protein